MEMRISNTRCPLLAHSCSIFPAAEFHSPLGLFIKLPHHLSSSPGPRHDKMSWLEVFCELCDTLCSVTTLILIDLFPVYTITVHGHETDPVLKLRWLYSFFLQKNIFDAFFDFNRRFPHVNLPHEFHSFPCDVVIWSICGALYEFSDAIVFPSSCCRRMFLVFSTKTQNRMTEYTHLRAELGNNSVLQHRKNIQ